MRRIKLSIENFLEEVDNNHLRISLPKLNFFAEMEKPEKISTSKIARDSIKLIEEEHGSIDGWDYNKDYFFISYRESNCLVVEKFLVEVEPMGCCEERLTTGNTYIYPYNTPLESGIEVDNRLIIWEGPASIDFFDKRLSPGEFNLGFEGKSKSRYVTGRISPVSLGFGANATLWRHRAIYHHVAKYLKQFNDIDGMFTISTIESGCVIKRKFEVSYVDHGIDIFKFRISIRSVSNLFLDNVDNNHINVFIEEASYKTELTNHQYDSPEHLLEKWVSENEFEKEMPHDVELTIKASWRENEKLVIKQFKLIPRSKRYFDLKIIN